MDKRLLHDEICLLDNMSFNFTFTSTFSAVYVRYISKSVPTKGFKAKYILEDGKVVKWFITQPCIYGVNVYFLLCHESLVNY